MISASLRRALLDIAPTPLVIVAAELTGLASLQAEGALPGKPAPKRLRAWLDRVRFLCSRSADGTPHLLFDPAYYLETNADVKNSRLPPVLHFLLWGAFEGRKPHPLFDPAWYLSQNSDVAACKLNPLQHYVRFGRREGRSPHPLFDAARYLYLYPDVQNAGYDPLVHFLLWGGAEGRQPHALFDCARYLSLKAVRDSGLNPLVHYLLRGGAQGLWPNRHFNPQRYAHHYPEVAQTGVPPLVHFVTCPERRGYDPHPGYPRPIRNMESGAPSLGVTLTLAGDRSRLGAPPAARRNRVDGNVLPVFVVYGRSNVCSIESRLIPALMQRAGVRFHLHTLHYRNAECLLSADALAASAGSLAGVTDWSARRDGPHIGFGESVNYLFDAVAPESCFYLVNPDSAPMPGCMDTLLATFRERSAAIVEARQWPMEHPKEYDAKTGATPWASGAFLLIGSGAFRELNGFDPIYFLYNEDVDLSWRAWLADMPVIYERSAVCAHFTGALSYTGTRYYYEHFFGIRNSLVLAYKFFGSDGEQAAWKWIQQASLPSDFVREVDRSYKTLRPAINRVSVKTPYYGDKIKIRGLNLYHELRAV